MLQGLLFGNPASSILSRVIGRSLQSRVRLDQLRLFRKEFFMSVLQGKRIVEDISRYGVLIAVQIGIQRSHLLDRDGMFFPDEVGLRRKHIFSSVVIYLGNIFLQKEFSVHFLGRGML